MSLRRDILNRALRLFERRSLARMKTPVEARRSFEWKARLWFHAPRGSVFAETSLAAETRAIPALSVLGKGAESDALILYFHGGGYFFGSPRTHRAMLARISRLSGLPALLPDYRKAPEHACPAALEDALAAYRAVLATRDAARIVIGGDSAGGGLTLALLARICAEGLPQPALTLALSPWTDLTGAGDSMTSNAETETMLPPERLHEVAEYYLQGLDPTDPRASPLFADFSGAGRVLITASSTEILLDDARRMAAALAGQNVDVTLVVEPDLPHVWQFFGGLMPEADHGLRVLAHHIAAAIRTPTSAGN
ncbi:MAG: alpha/beta hydrolase [Rhodobacteraceae bacterium]|nr:alpha/beta hydrolase [Paracoccaceae bacterium]